ncbi:MAG: Glutathione S-transferase, omega, partial [uncultured Solirubrobacteraceae bacterium]
EHRRTVSQGVRREGGLRPPAVSVPRPRHRRRRERLSRRGRPLPPLRVAGLPVGAPHGHRAQAQGPRGRHLAERRRSAARRARLALRPRLPRPAEQRLELPVGGLPRDGSLLRGPRDGADAVGHEDRPGRQQRVRGDHRHAQRGVGRLRRPPTSRSLPGRAAPRDRRAERLGVRRDQQRRLQVRLRRHPGGLRGRGSSAVRGAGPPRRAPRHPALPRRRRAHARRLAPVHHAGALRRRLRRPLQVQPQADRRLRAPQRLPARPLPASRRRSDRRLRPHQAPLLHDPRLDQPHGHRARRPAPRPRRTPRPL